MFLKASPSQRLFEQKGPVENGSPFLVISIGAYKNSLRADSSETCFLKASPNQGLLEQKGPGENRSPFLVASFGA